MLPLILEYDSSMAALRTESLIAESLVQSRRAIDSFLLYAAKSKAVKPSFVFAYLETPRASQYLTAFGRFADASEINGVTPVSDVSGINVVTPTSDA